MFGGARGKLKAEVLMFECESCVIKLWSSQEATIHVRSPVALAVTLQNASCASQSHISFLSCESQHNHLRLILNRNFDWIPDQHICHSICPRLARHLYFQPQHARFISLATTTLFCRVRHTTSLWHIMTRSRSKAPLRTLKSQQQMTRPPRTSKTSLKTQPPNLRSSQQRLRR